jgi:glycosyltransferase involved in cell wall biosynthesis
MGLPRAALVVQRAGHHAGASGYHQLAKHLVAGGTAVEVTHHFPRRGTWRVTRPLVARSGLTWYGQDACLTEVWAAAITAWRHPVLHFLQGENSYRYAAVVPGNPRRRLVATLHLPPSIFRSYVIPTQHLERLDAVIVLARNQLALLDGLRSPPTAFVVPHGIDVDFFRPPNIVPRDGPCLVVGQWLRDVATLKVVVREVRRATPSAGFRLILPADAVEHWRHRAGVEVLTGLDDLALRRSYQEAALLLMPLRDCTANNAVLEAMACGLPIVTTDVGGIRDYVDESCACLLPPGKPAAMAEAVLDLLGDPERRAAMGRASRARAEALAWPLVVNQIAAVYEALR